MRKNKSTLLILIFIILAVCGLEVFAFSLQTQAAGNIIYVDNTAPGCADGATTYDPATKTCGSGTDKIYTSVQKGTDNAAPGITVRVRTGIYNERITINKSGTETSRLTIEGEDGAIIDGHDGVLNGSWTEQPQIGQGVYKYNSLLPHEATVLTWNDREKIFDIPKVDTKGWYGDTWQSLMGMPADAQTDYSADGTVFGQYGFWENIGALYYSNANKELYVRFKNPESPAGKILRWGGNWSSTCLRMENDSNITVRNFHIRGCTNGILVFGQDAKNNIIENNTFYTGQIKLYLHTGTTNNEVRNNEFFMPMFSEYTPGGWSGCYDNPKGCSKVDLISYDYYKKFKSQFANGDMRDERDLLIAASNNKIYGNKFHDSMSAIGIISGSNNDIYENEIYNNSSAAIYAGAESKNIQVHDNLIYNVNIPYRLGSLNMAGGANGYKYPMSFYFYRNRVWLRDWVGESYLHFDCGTDWRTGLPWPVDCSGNGSYTPSEWADIYIYHNTFIGGRAAFTVSGFADEWGGIKDTFLVNNIFSSPWLLYGNWNTPAGGCGYNWMGGSAHPSWCDGTNKRHTDEFMWTNNFTSVPNFKLPAGSDAIDAGIDVSKSFTINSKTVGPLPGFSNNYWQGSAPDMGAVEYGAAGTGAYFKFDMGPGNPAETFIIQLNDTDKITQARNILNGTITDRVHVSGIISKTATVYNSPWRYNLTPASISFFENAVEVCDADPQYVEDHLDEACDAFLPNCRWCPWTSRLIAEVYPFDNPADVNGDDKVNIKDIQACIKVITQSNMTYENQCRVLATPNLTTNIKDIQIIIRKIINP